MNFFIVKKQSDRYPGLADDLPNEIVCHGTKEQAELLAERLSNYYPGCDYIFYVVDEENP
jgi:hypothetical protein